MKILLYGSFDHLMTRTIQNINNSIVKLSKNLKKDILLLNPDIIFICGVSKLETNNIYTVYITTKHLEAGDNDLVCFVKPLIYSELEDKLGYIKLTHFETTLPHIIDLSLKKTKGVYDFVNPGHINVSDLKKMYFKKNTPSNNFKEIDKYDYKHKLKHIQNYFYIDYTKKVNIYIPTYYRFEKTKKSLESIFKLCELSKYDIKCYIGDNNTKIKKMRDWLSTLKHDVYFNEKNEGKANIVNKLHKNARKCDYVFSIDSDMYTNDYSKNIIDEMIFILEYGYNIGIVSSNQYELCQHWFDGTINIFKERGMNLGETKDGVGIAGGCVVLRTSDWEQIGMYKENHDVYTGDDGILTKKIWNLGKRVVVSIDYFLVHPKPQDETEKEYQKWKRNAWIKDNLKFLDKNFTGSNKIGFYD